ncbi:acyltransferase family protein [Phenylobacterium sp. VNQ135]|uniref:acyltransferase family protein n=1 Tax=Phenylobacterium sp. VNQ135 TaxID=3400922 RepID=UPI003BFFD781
MTAGSSTEAPTRKAPGEVRSIQYLRGIAAFGVLVFHAAERAGGHFGVGAAGVDIFFVISGFIMWVVTCRKTPAPGDFLIRRVQRIVPLYWAVTLLVVGVALAIPGSFPNLQVTFEALAKSLFFVPYQDPNGLIAPLIVPGWTLNYEMFFYLLFAAGLLAPARLRPWLVSAALIALVAVRPLLDAENPLVATYTDPILLEFGAGVWLGKLWSEDRLPRVSLGWAMAALGLAGFVAVTLAGVDVATARVLWWGVPALLLVAGAVSVERHGRVPDLWPLRVIGDASYSLYLVHGLAISAAIRVLGAVGLNNPALVFTASLVAGVIAGLAAYHLAEKPMMKLFRTGLGAHRPSGVAPAPAP